MSKRNDGKDAESAFEDYWNGVGHCERLRDKKDLMGINRHLKQLADFAKPSDFIVSSPTVPLHYAEVKSTVDGKSFAFGKIRPAQSSAAQKEYISGSRAYIFYIFSYALGAWFVMPCEQYAHALKMGRRSISFEDLAPWKQ